MRTVRKVKYVVRKESDIEGYKQLPNVLTYLNIYSI